ncbi:UNC93-like protein 3 [Quillaja saponaria]|uniref:UNC93-like protein 3 n=1 Tax=Quillaja saponaria TaxID=32244 RepID=A0AAD7VIT6_QUISA|nr:UNC93-like protein 3 [Quillaja saponaria]
MASVVSNDEEAPLIVDNLPIQAPKNYTRDVHILSSAFLLIFLAYGAAQNLESTLNTEEDLGTISLGILYLSFTFFSLVASVVVRLLGSKNALILGTTGYWLFIAANLRPTWYTMVPASVYLGFTASIIWVGEGTYLTSTAQGHATDYNLHEGAVIGNFNGEFWGLFACHQLIGNLVSLALLRDGKEGSTSGTTLLFIVFLFSMTLGTILMCFLSKNSGNEKQVGQSDAADSVYSSLISLPKLLSRTLSDVRMLLIIPLIAYSGLQQAFVWAEFTKYVVTPVLGVSGVGGSMAVYGAIDAICSLAAGRLTSGLPTITLIVSGGAFVHAIVFFLLLLNYSLTSGVLGILYPLHDMEGAFAQLKVWQSASIAVVFFLSPCISLQAMLVIMLVSLFLSYAGFLLLTLKVEKAFFSSSSS